MSSTFAVRPPDDAKKNVVATLPLYVSTWFAVATTAASVLGVSAATPPYIWLRVSEKTSNWPPEALSASAYDRAATACAPSAAACQDEGISHAITPRT